MTEIICKRLLRVTENDELFAPSSQFREHLERKRCMNRTANRLRRMSAEALHDPPGIELVVVDLEDHEDLARAWVVDPVWDVVEAAQRAQTSEGRSGLVVVVVVGDASSSSRHAALADAGIAALRGLVHSLTLEVGDSIALNLVVLPSGREEQADETLRFLASEDAAWIQGATLDLRGS